MKRYLIYCLLFSCAIVGCKKNTNDNTDIVVDKPVKQVEKHTQSMDDSDYKQDLRIHWLDKDYTLVVERKKDETLPVVYDESGAKYFDNRVKVRVVREDGTDAFTHDFIKSDFTSCYAGVKYAEKGGLLGVVYDRVEGGRLILAASVGSPESSSDMYVPIAITISPSGGYSVARDNRMDIDNNNVYDEEENTP